MYNFIEIGVLFDDNSNWEKYHLSFKEPVAENNRMAVTQGFFEKIKGGENLSGCDPKGSFFNINLKKTKSFTVKLLENL